MNRPRPGDSPTARYGRASGGAVRSTPERPDTTHLYDLNGQPLKVSNVDAGWRLSLPGLAGQTVQRWDARGVHWRNRYDELLRLVSISNSADPLSDTFTYADASAPADHNQRGRLLEQLDPSGSLHLDSYSLAGQPLRERRTFTDAREFVTQRIFSPLDAVLEQTDAGGHRQQCATTSPVSSNICNCCWPDTHLASGVARRALQRRRTDHRATGRQWHQPLLAL
jgi:hypothetical protein